MPLYAAAFPFWIPNLGTGDGVCIRYVLSNMFFVKSVNVIDNCWQFCPFSDQVCNNVFHGAVVALLALVGVFILVLERTQKTKFAVGTALRSSVVVCVPGNGIVSRSGIDRYLYHR